MFSLYLDWKHFYEFDIFRPGDVLYVTKTNVKELDYVRPFITTLVNHIVLVCQTNNLQFLILHNPIYPFSIEESLNIEQSVSKKMAKIQTLAQ
jgi:hypothetical protein